MSEEPKVSAAPINEATGNPAAEDGVANNEATENAIVEENATPVRAEGAKGNAVTEDFEAGVLAQLDSLYRAALRLTHNQQEAEDLVQETMLKAFRFANSYRKQATHPATTSLPEGEDFYLYNRIRDISGQELSAGAEDEVLSRYLDEDVYKALNDLPLNFRMPIILADIEGMSYKEISQD